MGPRFERAHNRVSERDGIGWRNGHRAQIGQDRRVYPPREPRGAYSSAATQKLRGATTTRTRRSRRNGRSSSDGIWPRNVTSGRTHGRGWMRPGVSTPAIVSVRSGRRVRACATAWRRPGPSPG
jgi:hypothetical protein